MNDATGSNRAGAGGELISVALFPLPGMVTFPGVSVPLHIFEPRYRTMIAQCIAENRELALCHAQKEIRPARKNRNMEELLQNNQATYLPCKVFSAGPCEVLDSTSDGRLYIKVRVRRRLRLVEETQTLPYRIALCEELKDAAASGDEDGCRKLQEEIRRQLVQLLGEKRPQIAQLLDHPDWRSLQPAEFSFRIFGLLRFDGDFMQQLLECPVVEKRLALIHRMLKETRPG